MIRQTYRSLLTLAIVATCACTHSSQSGLHASSNVLKARAASEKQPIAPGKFIPTFAILYEGPKSEQTLKGAARFDLIDAGASAVSNPNIWPELKQLNPHLKIFVYEMGPGEFNTWMNYNGNQGWDWVAANHGLASADRWTAVATHGGYLQSGKAQPLISDDSPWHNYWYPQFLNYFVLDGKERLMLIGNPNWQQYWLDGMYNRFWSPASPNRNADGVFSDNTDYEWPSEGGWFREGTDQPDLPADYYHNGIYVPEIWKKEARVFLDRAVVWLGERHRLLLPNFGRMAQQPQTWHDLDSQPNSVFAAMEEGAFVTPWGKKGYFTFYSEQEWLHQVKAMRQLNHVRALMLVHGPLVSPKQDLSRMDYADAGGTNCGWDILWFGITSFLQGYDDVRQNAYLGFTVWGYGHVFYFDEFDPAHLNLGHSRGESHRVNAAVGHCYLREFDAGWAVVNPTDNPAEGIPVPNGAARVVNHASFENPESQPLVTRFNLPAHRGVILLKPDQHIGNAN